MTFASADHGAVAGRRREIGHIVPFSGRTGCVIDRGHIGRRVAFTGSQNLHETCDTRSRASELRPVTASAYCQHGLALEMEETFADSAAGVAAKASQRDKIEHLARYARAEASRPTRPAITAYLPRRALIAPGSFSKPAIGRVPMEGGPKSAGGAAMVLAWEQRRMREFDELRCGFVRVVKGGQGRSLTPFCSAYE
jgi:hypothetical protein